MRHNTFRLTLVTTVMLSVLVLPGAVRAHDDPEDPIARLIAHIDASSRELPAFGIIETESDPNPDAPSTQLRTLLKDVTELGPGKQGQGALPQPVRDHVDDAASRLRTAIALRGATVLPGESQTLDEVFDALRETTVELTNAQELPKGLPLRDKLSALSGRTAVVARQIATEVIASAALSEDNARIVAQAREQIALGDLARLEDDPALAVALYQFGMSFAANVITFHGDVFEQNIRDALADVTVGWAYSIGLSGAVFNEDSDGLARTAADTPPNSPGLPQSSTKEMFIASVSKVISAVALLKLLDETGISVEQPIAPYLPADWTQRGDNVDQITFRHLLTHRSGLLSEDADTLESLEDAISQGSSGPSNDNPVEYSNVNYNVLRVLIPQIANGPGAIANYANIWPLDAVYAGLYIDYVRSNVLMPALINKSDCAPIESPEQQTLLYSLNDPPEANGVRTDDWNLKCGAAGWYLSANELSSFLAYLRFTDDILDADTRARMDDLFLGWHDPIEYANWVDGVFGVYRAHSGDIYFIEGKPGSAGMNACVMNFQINVQASLLINSRGGGVGRPCTILRDAYDTAWF